MGKYNGAVITTAGQNVISQAISGTELTWLTMKTSSTAIPAGTNVETLTTLSGIEQTSNITDATVYGNNVLQLSARFSNTNISTAYYIQTVGIYGQLAGGSETLIAVMTAVMPDEMPVYDPDAPSAFIFNVQITVQNAESVVMTVNDTGTATVADLNRKVDIQSGNVSNTVITTITTSSASYPSIAAGDTVATAAGKVNKNLADLGSNKLDKTGDAADAKIGSSTASTASYPVPAANDTFKVILGKIIKFFADIKAAYTNVSISGKKITFTTAAGGTKEITTQDTTYSVVSKTANGLAPKLPNETATTKYLRQDGSWQVPPNTTYNVVSKTANGLAPQLPNETATTKYLRQDGSWQVPPNTTYGLASTSANGLLRQLNNSTANYMRGDGTWQTPPNTWRPVQNNLTSISTTDCLSAYQGKVLNVNKQNAIKIAEKTETITVGSKTTRDYTFSPTVLGITGSVTILTTDVYVMGAAYNNYFVNCDTYINGTGVKVYMYNALSASANIPIRVRVTYY